MIEEHVVGLGEDVAGAYRLLHLLPSAPRDLVDDVYRALRSRLFASAAGADPQLVAELQRLASAYEVVVAHAKAAGVNGATAGHSPWALLHVDRDAPPEIVELAYRFRRSARGDVAPPTKDMETHVARAGRDDVTQATSPSSSGPVRLVAETGTARPPRAAIGESALRIGGDPTCDIVVAVRETRRGRTEARLWRRRGRVLFHGVAGHILVNGHAVGWAVLDGGDTVQVADTVFRLETERLAPIG